MRSTSQTKNLTGALLDEEARVIVARAILGEWLAARVAAGRIRAGSSPA